MVDTFHIGGIKVVFSQFIKPEPKIKCGPIPYAEDVVENFNQWLGDRFGWIHPIYMIGDAAHAPLCRKEEFLNAAKGLLYEPPKR